MRHRWLAASASLALVGALLPTSVAARSPDALERQSAAARALPGAEATRRPVVVMLELEGAPVAVREGRALERGERLSRAQKEAAAASLRDAQAPVRAAAIAAGGKVEGAYQHAYNGVRVRIAESRLARLAAIPGVVKVHRLQTYELDNTNTLRHLGVPGTWGATGRTGAGVKVAIIDTGVDYHHVNFGGTGAAAYTADSGTNPPDGSPDDDEFPTSKVIGGYDFVGDAYDASNPDADTPAPDPDPLDCNAHGTHVAGTSAGYGVTLAGTRYTGTYNATTLSRTQFAIGPGMAPAAKILAYRVFGCGGSTNVVVDALERAYQDGANVVNMSLGSPFGRPDTPEAVASNNISYAGVVVVASAGNSGRSAYITGSPASAPLVLSVAALDAIPSIPIVTIDMPGSTANIEAQNSNGDAGPWPITAELEVLRDPTGGMSLGCAESEYSGTQGKIVVTLRGTCARVDRAKFGDNAGAAAVIMVNTSDSYPPFEGPITGVDIPFLGVPSSAKQPLDAADGQTVTLNPKQCKTSGGATIPCPNPGYKRNASFTSGGPGRILDLVKPEIIAPGVGVVSALVGSGNGGLPASGTSMSSPAVAGIAALVKQAHPTWRASWIKAAIVGTATTSTSKIVGYDMRLAGAGVIDPHRAITTRSFVTTRNGTATLSFGHRLLGATDIDPVYTDTRDMWIHNRGTTSMTFDLASAFHGDARGASISISPRTVTVAAGGTARILVTLTIPHSAIPGLPGARASNVVSDAHGIRATLQMLRGFVTATPRSTAAGWWPIRVPFNSVPRGVSNIRVSGRTPYTKSGDVATTSVTVENSGLHRGSAEVFAWGLEDGREGYESSDIRAVGVKSVSKAYCDSRLVEEASFPADDRCLVFAINTWGRWSNPAVNEFDIAIDTAPCPVTPLPVVCANDDPEFRLVGVDHGAITSGSFNGAMGVFLFKPDYSEREDFVYLADAPTNGSTLFLMVHASALGLTPAGDTEFDYFAESFQIFDGSPGEGYDLATTGLEAADAQARFDAFAPAMSQGASTSLAPGASTRLALRVRSSEYDPDTMQGWMIVTVDDPQGGQQASLVPAGTVP